LKSPSEYKKLVNKNSRNAAEKSCGYFDRRVIDIGKLFEFEIAETGKQE